MIAAGSGITPMYQILLSENALSNSNKTRNIYLIYSNHTLEDIWLKQELDEIFSKYECGFTRKILYLVTGKRKVCILVIKRFKLFISHLIKCFKHFRNYQVRIARKMIYFIKESLLQYYPRSFQVI